MYRFKIKQSIDSIPDLNGEAQKVSQIYLELRSIESKVYFDKWHFTKDITTIREGLEETSDKTYQDVIGPVVSSDRSSIDLFLLKSNRVIRIGKLERV